MKYTVIFSKRMVAFKLLTVATDLHMFHEKAKLGTFFSYKRVSHAPNHETTDLAEDMALYKEK